MYVSQRVIERCRLPWLTKSALVYEPKCGGREGVAVAGSHPMSTTVYITRHGAQINFGDLPPYLTYDVKM
jgi:hypothetical protein